MKFLARRIINAVKKDIQISASYDPVKVQIYLTIKLLGITVIDQAIPI